MRVKEMKKFMSYIAEIEETERVQIEVKGTLDGFLFNVFSDDKVITHAIISEYADANERVMMIRELRQSIALYKEKKLREREQAKAKNIEFLNKITQEQNKDYLEVFYKIEENAKKEVAKIILITNETAFLGTVLISQPHDFFKSKVERMFEEAKEKKEGKRMRLIDADDVKKIICKHEKRLVQRQMIYEIERLKSYSNEAVKMMIQGRIKELKNSRAGYMVCGISCNHAVIAELERLLKEIE